MLENLSRENDPLPSKATKSICIAHKRDSHVTRKDFSPRYVTWSISEKSSLLLHDIHGCFVTTNDDDSLGSLPDREYRSIRFSQLCELEGGAKWTIAEPLKNESRASRLTDIQRFEFARANFREGQEGTEASVAYCVLSG